MMVEPTLLGVFGMHPIALLLLTVARDNASRLTAPFRTFSASPTVRRRWGGAAGPRRVGGGKVAPSCQLRPPITAWQRHRRIEGPIDRLGHPAPDTRRAPNAPATATAAGAMQSSTCSRGLRVRGMPACRAPRTATRAVAEPVAPIAPPPKGEVPPGLNKYSGRITQPKSQGASQAMLYATGLNEDDMNKPQVGVAARQGYTLGTWRHLGLRTHPNLLPYCGGARQRTSAAPPAWPPRRLPAASHHPPRSTHKRPNTPPAHSPTHRLPGGHLLRLVGGKPVQHAPQRPGGRG